MLKVVKMEKAMEQALAAAEMAIKLPAEKAEQLSSAAAQSLLWDM